MVMSRLWTIRCSKVNDNWALPFSTLESILSEHGVRSARSFNVKPLMRRRFRILRPISVENIGELSIFIEFFACSESFAFGRLLIDSRF
ncbi:MAG: hypothetical protein A3J24_05350 [Deltaproteobacteria bacterium RIFCSPLOWO2_02_FULL_53_8]|nr:MAG: hypothetical protein A3J24_05350 [Deltaproteobacteria bacterium RIFCSPLOWO2_02_FULL_53_8]